jgi:vacuolar-type H+-ATPase subunit I/STV1
MSVVACDIYRLEVNQKNILPVLVELELLDVFEPVKPLFKVEMQMYQALLQEVTREREQVSRVIEVLRTTVGIELSRKRQAITSEFSSQIYSHAKLLKSIIVDIEKKSLELSDLAKEQEFATTQRARFEKIKDISLPVYQAHELVLGTVLVVDKRYFSTVERALDGIKNLDTTFLKESSEAIFLAVAYAPELRANIEQLIQQPYCHELMVSNEITAASPAEAYQEYDRRLGEIELTTQVIKDKLSALATDHLQELVGWHDLLLLQERSLQTLEYVGYTPGSTTNTRWFSSEQSQSLVEKFGDKESILNGLSEQDIVHIDGWIDPSQVHLLKARLEKLDFEVTLTKFDVSNDPEARTVLRNNRLLRPFEVITNLMGTPHTTEIDPSPYVAPFFVLFFGFALGDAGYGLLMVAIVLYFYRKRELYSRQLRNVMGLMMYCGLSTTVFGILTGSWFGLDLGALGTAGSFLSSFKVLDLQSNIIMLLIASLITGFVHQLFGLFLAMMSAWKDGRIAEAIQVPGTWLLFLISIGYAFAVSFTQELSYLSATVQPVLLASFILFALGQGYGSPWYIRPFKGILGVFNLTSYLSNTLSYARLLALALATGVIASVVNLIAVMAGGSLPLIIGVPIIILVAFVGHAFNIVLNLMGTFINVARLHLVEFFPRFFEAKGASLTPLQSQPTYSFFAENFSTRDLNFDQFKLHSSNK